MEERIEISLMLDYYGDLLTEKQKEIMTMYYNEDLSLAEISEINSTSRQAIHDAIKRCHKQLLNYENKLRILEKETKRQKIKEDILETIEGIDKDNLNDYNHKIIKKLLNIAEDI